MTSRVDQLLFLMKQASQRAAVVCAFAVLACGHAVQAQLLPKDKPEPVRGLELADTRGRQVPLDLQFFDEDANAVRLGNYFSRAGVPSDGSTRQFKKPVVVMMMYYSCPLQCPQSLEGLHAVLNGVEGYTVGNDFDVLVVSFDPRDKPRDAAVKKIASLLAYNRPTTDSVRQGWTFLTSPPASARSLADALGFPFRYLPESGEFGHPTALFVLTPEGRVSRSFPFTKFPATDLRFALLEATNGRIGDTFDRFTFWCYHYDPSRGVYTLQAMRVMQLGGAITVVILTVVLLALLRHERRKARRIALGAMTGATAIEPYSAERALQVDAMAKGPMVIAGSGKGNLGRAGSV